MSPPAMPIDRCVCFDVPFSELKKYAESRPCRYEDLRKRFNCGRGCGLCIPYIRKLLLTGQTSCPVKTSNCRDSGV